MADYFQILCAIAAVILYLYYYCTSNFDYWTKNNIRGPPPKPLVGNAGDVFMAKLSITDNLKNLYDEYKDEKMFGVFVSRKPTLIINDLDLIKDILIRDFSLFADRGIKINTRIEPLADHLFTMEASKWRPMRARLSPIFTSGKLKEMFPLIVECSENLEKYMDKILTTGEPLECKELAAKFTTDVIGSCVFGINMNALSNEESEFRRMGKALFATDWKVVLRNALRQYAPFFYKIFGRMLHRLEVEKFFINMISETMKYRKENNIMRPDFISMLMELKDHPEKLNNMELTDTLLTAQAFVFFAAGFETSSSTIANCLYELAQNQDVQDKLRNEIRESLKNHNGILTYEQIKDMTYLDKVFKETLRKYPVLAMLMRAPMQNYTFKETKVTIPKNTLIWIPVQAIQRDPKYYPKPDVFDPERFNEDAVAARHPMSYLPFGDGPRNCIGARFANYQSKLGIITIIRNHKVDVCSKTTIPYKSDPRSFLMSMREINLNSTKV